MLFLLYHFKAPSNSSQALNLILFIFHFSCFHYRSSHGGSSRFNSSSKSSSRFLLEIKHSSSCFQLQFFLPYLFRWCYVILVNSFLFHDSRVIKNEIFKTIIFLCSGNFFQPFNYLLELSWVIFHLKAFPKDCC